MKGSENVAVIAREILAVLDAHREPVEGFGVYSLDIIGDLERGQFHERLTAALAHLQQEQSNG